MRFFVYSMILWVIMLSYSNNHNNDSFHEPVKTRVINQYVFRSMEIVGTAPLKSTIDTFFQYYISDNCGTTNLF